MSTRWLDEDENTWLCQAHLSTVRIPAKADRCWYAGCLSERPEKGGASVALIRAREVIEAVRVRAQEALRMASQGCPVCGAGSDKRYCSHEHQEVAALRSIGWPPVGVRPSTRAEYEAQVGRP